MLTPAGSREVVVTATAKVPPGAQMFGGRYDGAIVRRTHRLNSSTAVFILDDGTELQADPLAPSAWLHPAGRAVAR